LSQASTTTTAPPLDVDAARFRLVGILMATCSILLFSSRPLLVKYIYLFSADAVTLLALRMSFSAPIFLLGWWLLGRRQGRGAPLHARDIAIVAALGGLGYYLASFLDMLGLLYVSAGLGRLILFVYPTIVVLLSAVFLGTRPRARDIGGLVITYVGIALVLSQELGGDNHALLFGVLLVFGSALSYSVSLVAGSELTRRIGSLRFTAGSLGVATLCALAQFLVLRPFSALDLPMEVFVAAAAIGLFCTAIPVFLTAEALRRVGAGTVAIIGALGPPWAMVLEQVVLGVTPNLMQYVGTAVVIGGVMLVTLRSRR